MSGFVVTVALHVDPRDLGRFLELIGENARQSRQEPGCRVFDICAALGEENRIFLYEVYDDENAFEDHLRTAHYKTFAANDLRFLSKTRIEKFAMLSGVAA
jgi:quinol monooxygenase YgiN